MAMTHMDDYAHVRAMAEPFGLELSDDEIQRLGAFLDLLEQANARMNLTRITDRDEAWTRHIMDSLTLLPYIEAAGATNLIDIGSGGGLPGLPLAIVRPDLPITLLEATGKKARYLAETADSLGLTNITVLADRAETLGAPDGGGRDAWDVITARAVGPLRVLLELAMPLVRDGGWLLAIKGPSRWRGNRGGRQSASGFAVRSRRDTPHANRDDCAGAPCGIDSKALSA